MPFPPLRRRHTDLPIEAAAADISSAIAGGSLVLTAEPGAGKSSVVPLLAADETDRQVVLLEPRRLAARATAQRLSDLIEDCSGVGDTVGLTIRGERKHSSRTRIEVVTEAVLTARLQRDPEAPGVGVVILDEFHERNLHSDLGLAMALESRATIRPDLAIVVMSATLDAEPVAELLETDQVVSVPGRTHPVETIHLSRPTGAAWVGAVVEATHRAATEVAGDVLVFVPGRREIHAVMGRIDRDHGRRQVIGLHGGAGLDVQQAALRGGTGQRIIVSTAVAETSLTLPGIEAVVDGGLLRRARFDPTTGLGRLETVNVTRFAADQRRGRAGRLAPGICYRLWSVDDHRHLDAAVPPEIVDGDPLPVAFELARWGDPDGTDLPLLDHPGSARLAAGRTVLEQLGLVTPDGVLTEQGRAAGGLGVHPRLGRLLLIAFEQGLGHLGLRIAALLDSDQWPDTADLAAELDRRNRDLDRATRRLGRRVGRTLGKARSMPATPADLAPLLGAAWPDRIAKSRRGRPGHYLLATGREVRLRGEGTLSGAEFLVVAEAEGVARAATVRRAVAIDRATVLRSAAEHVRWIEEVDWDERTDSIRSERQQRLGSIVLHREPLPKPDPSLVVAALGVGLRRRGLDLLRWTDRAVALRQRLSWLHEMAPDDWPSVSDHSLLERLDEWLDLSRCRTPADLRRLTVGSNILDVLDWEDRRRLDDLAPVALQTPSGSSRRVDYDSGRPVWSVRLQDVLGLDEHPLVGPLRQPVTIELLSPASRPVQVTNDLPGFWRGSYAGVRSDLRGRYPKHRWPERPWES